MSKRLFEVLEVFLAGLCLAAVGILLIDKLELGIIRYFDADEFAYLHWAHNVFAGRLPYRDFLAYIPPGFFYLLAPLYWFTNGVEILYFGRVFAYVVFFGLVVSVGMLFWQMRRHTLAAITAGLLLAFIPIPADKFLEVRPDNAAMLLAVLGAIIHCIGFSGVRKPAIWFFAGALYMLSFLILPKTLPQVVIAVGVTLLWWRWGEGALVERTRHIGLFAAGLVAPAAVFGGWLVVSLRPADGLSMAWYSLTKLPFEAQKISALFPLQPDLFFYPNNLLYGQPGWNTGLFVNHAVWLAGLITGSIRLATPFVANGRKGVWAECITGGAFLGYIVSFMYGYPMRHEQYLIPISIFVVFYAADGFYMLWKLVPQKPVFAVARAALFVVLIAGVMQVHSQIQIPKLAMTNAGDYAVLRFALRTIPEDAYVFDLVGSTVYFRDPYYVSSVPFGQWAPYLSRPLPNIPEALDRTRTAYVYEGLLGRLDNLPHDAVSYIRQFYTPVKGIPGMYGR